MTTPAKLYLADFARRAQIDTATLRAYRTRGTPRGNPVPDPDGTEMIAGHARPWWSPATIDGWIAARTGAGYRSDLQPKHGKETPAMPDDVLTPKMIDGLHWIGSPDPIKRRWSYHRPTKPTIAALRRRGLLADDSLDLSNIGQRAAQDNASTGNLPEGVTSPDPRYLGAVAGVPFDSGNGPVPGYVAGRCGHRVAESEWRAGFRNCERCG